MMRKEPRTPPGGHGHAGPRRDRSPTTWPVRSPRAEALIAPGPIRPAGHGADGATERRSSPSLNN